MKIFGHTFYACENFPEHITYTWACWVEYCSSSEVLALAKLLPGIVLPFDTPAGSGYRSLFVVSPDPDVWWFDSWGLSVFYCWILFIRGIRSMEFCVPWIVKGFLLRSFIFAFIGAYRVSMVPDQVCNKFSAWVSHTRQVSVHLDRRPLHSSGLGIIFLKWFFFLPKSPGKWQDSICFLWPVGYNLLVHILWVGSSLTFQAAYRIPPASISYDLEAI